MYSADDIAQHGTGFAATAPLLVSACKSFLDRIGWPSKLPYDQRPDYVPDSRPIVRFARRLGDVRPISLIPAAAILEMGWLRPFGDISFTRMFNDHWGVPTWLQNHQYGTLTVVGVGFSAALFGITKMFHRPSTWEFRDRSSLLEAQVLDGLLLGMYPYNRTTHAETVVPHNKYVGSWSKGELRCWAMEVAFTTFVAVPAFAWALDRPIIISGLSGMGMAASYLLGFAHMTKVLLDRGGDSAELLNLYRIVGFNLMNGIVLAASTTGVDPAKAWLVQVGISLSFTAALFGIFRPTLPATAATGRAADMEIIDIDDEAA